MVCAGITLNSNYISIAYVSADGTRGASTSDPYRLVDVYDTDVANGWGLTTKAGNSYYIVGRGLQISGATFFKMDDESLEVGGTVPVRPFNFRNTSAGYIDIYRSYIAFITAQGVYVDLVFYGRISESTINHYYYLYLGGLSADFPITIQKSTISTVRWVQALNYINADIVIMALGTIGLTPKIGEFNNMFFVGNQGIYTYTMANPTTFRNAIVQSELRFLNFRMNPNGGVINLIDCKCDPYLYRLSVVENGEQNAYYKTTFNAMITNGNGGTLTIEDKNGNIIYTEVLSSDNMTAQEIAYIRHQLIQSGGSYTTNEHTEYTPFKLKVSKNGYQDLEISNITVTSGVPTVIRGDLRSPTYAEVPPEVEMDSEPTTIALLEIETQ